MTSTRARRREIRVRELGHCPVPVNPVHPVHLPAAPQVIRPPNVAPASSLQPPASRPARSFPPVLLSKIYPGSRREFFLGFAGESGCRHATLRGCVPGRLCRLRQHIAGGVSFNCGVCRRPAIDVQPRHSSDPGGQVFCMSRPGREEARSRPAARHAGRAPRPIWAVRRLSCRAIRTTVNYGSA